MHQSIESLWAGQQGFVAFSVAFLRRNIALCPHPYRVRSQGYGFSHGLSKCPPDTYLPSRWSGRPFIFLVWRSSRDLSHFRFAEIMELIPSSRDQATVHRTVALDFQIPLYHQKKTHPHEGVDLFWRSSRDLNPGALLQTYEISSHASSTT